jgi:4-amino-4-deoxy-L-arabinose transferase-like glycosyltransferase
MAAVLLLVLLIGYVGLALMFVAAAWKAPRRPKWLGLAAIAAAAPFFFWLGAFSEQFNSGQCYSRAIGNVANAVENTDDPRGLAKRLHALPTYGYETVCSDLEAAAAALPNASAP